MPTCQADSTCALSPGSPAWCGRLPLADVQRPVLAFVAKRWWRGPRGLPAQLLRKRRHLVRRDGLLVAVDELEDGTLIAEIDDHDQPSDSVPEWLDVVDDVTSDEAWTGSQLAR